MREVIGYDLAEFFERNAERLREDGVKGLVPRSSKPKSHRGRRWTAADERRVVALRREMPWAGKVRIALELAARWPEHALSWKPRDWHFGVQIDSMTMHIEGKTFKEFRAVCPLTRRQFAKVYPRATAHVARAFLREAAGRLGIKAVQVDGGSEFRAVFKDECEARRLPLLVLPPYSPQLNGIVERANRTVRIECWSQYLGELTCAAMNEALDTYLDYNNNRRPLRALGMKSPAEFATMIEVAA